jgi:hypothetical protein
MVLVSHRSPRAHRILVEVYYPRSVKAGHHYEVRVNKQTSNPNIVTVIRELER